MKEFVLENPPRRRRRRSSRRRTAARSTRRSVRRSRVRRSSRRRTSRRRRSGTFLVRGSSVKINPFNPRSVFSKQNMLIAGGAVLASVASNLIIGRAGRFLPGVMSPFGRAAYNTLLPVALAMVGQRFSPDLAKGLVVGGVANGLGQVLTATRVLPAGSVVTSMPAPASPPPAPSGTQGTGQYLGEYLGEYLGGGSDMMDVGAAFATDAWGQ